MKKLYKYLIVFIVPFMLFFSWPSGSPGGLTGSPGDGGETCTNCHDSFEVESQSNWITSNIPAEGYTPGETYVITATGTHAGVVNFGFELTAEDNAGTKTGTFSVTDETRTKFANNNLAITHTANGITPTDNSNTWSMDWTAPSEDTGEVMFYAAFNAGNGTGGTSGDQIYTSVLNAKQSTVGIGDDLFAEEIKLYPNPATNYFNIDIPEGSEIRIFDVLGHQVFKNEKANYQERIDISGFEAGFYFVQVLNDGNTASMRMMKR